MKTNTPHAPAPDSPAHTPAPWVAVSPHPGQFAIVPENRQKHAPTHTLAYVRDFQANDEANAARIVACVNACEGLSDPVAQIKALRDALIQSCKDILWIAQEAEKRAGVPRAIIGAARHSAQKALANFSKGGAK